MMAIASWMDVATNTFSDFAAKATSSPNIRSSSTTRQVIFLLFAADSSEAFGFIDFFVEFVSLVLERSAFVVLIQRKNQEQNGSRSPVVGIFVPVHPFPEADHDLLGADHKPVEHHTSESRATQGTDPALHRTRGLGEEFDHGLFFSSVCLAISSRLTS